MGRGGAREQGTGTRDKGTGDRGTKKGERDSEKNVHYSNSERIDPGNLKITHPSIHPSIYSIHSILDTQHKLAREKKKKKNLNNNKKKKEKKEEE